MVDKSQVMSSKRSTRRSVNPPENEDAPKAVGKEGGLGDVESILNEIEDLVSGVGTDETARPTPVVEDQNHSGLEGSPEARKNASVDEVEDVRQLRDELDAAIASELMESGSTPQHEVIQNDDTTPIESTLPTNSSTVSDGGKSDTTNVTDANELETKSSEAEGVLPNTESERMPSGVLKMLSAPVEALSSRNRSLVTIFAVSMALWVPLVWTAALMTEPEVPSQAPETLFTANVPLDQGNEVLGEQ